MEQAVSKAIACFRSKGLSRKGRDPKNQPVTVMASAHLLAVILVAQSAAPVVSPEIHKLCLDAKDYQGCVNAQTSKSADPNGKRRWERDSGELVVFDPLSVKAIQARGQWGRYIEYRYVYRGYQQGSSGYSSPGVQMPSTATTSVYGNTAYTTITPGATVGAFSIPGRAGGPVSRTWKVQADCVDFTADWEGDDQGWRKLRATSLKEDSSKEAVGILEEFCPRMAELVDAAKSAGQSKD